MKANILVQRNTMMASVRQAVEAALDNVEKGNPSDIRIEPATLRTVSHVRRVKVVTPAGYSGEVLRVYTEAEVSLRVRVVGYSSTEEVEKSALSI